MKSKVSVVCCTDYSYDKVISSVRRAYDLVGGAKSLDGGGNRVFLKVNLLQPSRPEKAIISHPAVVKAVTEVLQSDGFYVIIGDSPGGPMLKRMLQSTYKTSGLMQVADESGAELNYDVGYEYVHYPQGKLVKGFEVLNIVRDVDHIVTLPKLKTHVLTRFTGATKILFGVVPGLLKSAYHAKLRDVENFSEMLIDLLQLIKPELSIMDGIVGMEGNGPAGGRPRDVGVILASSDSVALDVIAASIINMDPDSITTLKAARKRGLWSGNMADIDVVGESVEDVRVSDYVHPSSLKLNRLLDLLSGFSKSLFIVSPYSNESCVGCGICESNCPVKAITLSDGVAHMDLSKCIRCYCCHEMCPHSAVDLRKSRLARVLRL